MLMIGQQPSSTTWHWSAPSWNVMSSSRPQTHHWQWQYSEEAPERVGERLKIKVCGSR